MKQAHLSEQSEADLIDIWFYIAQDDVAAADRFVSLLRGKCHQLAQTPGMGSERAELAAGLRGFPVRNYLVFYRPTPDGIDVARILSGYRDFPPLFQA